MPWARPGSRFTLLFEQAVLTLVLSYWFGNCVAKYAFGWDNKR